MDCEVEDTEDTFVWADDAAHTSALQITFGLKIARMGGRHQRPVWGHLPRNSLPRGAAPHASGPRGTLDYYDETTTITLQNMSSLLTPNYMYYSAIRPNPSRNDQAHGSPLGRLFFQITVAPAAALGSQASGPPTPAEAPATPERGGVFALPRVSPARMEQQSIHEVSEARLNSD